MAKKEKAAKPKPKPKPEPEKMSLHDTLAQALGHIGEGMKTGSLVSMRKAHALVTEAMQGSVRPPKPPIVEDDDGDDGDDDDDDSGVQVVEE